jgi:hypothetical protein
MDTDDDDLRIWLGRIRNGGARYKGFFAEVRSAAPRSGPAGARFAGSPMPLAGLLNSTRRVIVKARIVRHRGPRSAALSAHVRYLKRDGVTRTGETALMCARETDLTDERAFAERCRDDRTTFGLS